MNDIFSNLNSACIDSFSEPFLLKASNGNIELCGVFNVIPDDERIGIAPFPNQRYELQTLESVAVENNIARLQTVIVRGVEYQIIGYAADMAGMANLTLRKYR